MDEKLCKPIESLKDESLQFMSPERLTFPKGYIIFLTKDGLYSIGKVIGDYQDSAFKFFFTNDPSISNIELIKLKDIWNKNIQISCGLHWLPLILYDSNDNCFFTSYAKRIKLKEIKYQSIYGDNTYKVSFSSDQNPDKEFIDYGISWYSNGIIEFYYHSYLILAPNSKNQGGFTSLIDKYYSDIKEKFLDVELNETDEQRFYRAIEILEKKLSEKTIFSLLRDDLKNERIDEIKKNYKWLKASYKKEKNTLDFFNNLSKKIIIN